MLVGEHFQPYHFVFTDESHFNRVTLQRPWAWSPRRNRARRRDFFIRGHRYSILPALSLDGILHLEVLDHSFTGEDFADFIEGVLDQMQPWPLPNSVLVMDNASIHKVPGIREMVEERYITAWLWANRDYVLRETEGYDCDPYALIWEAVYGVVTPDKIYGWYQHSEYIA
ncbi:hypothetical protein L208DRAFT_1260865 [Tricholoma matsutake]|nr:hypothetical protein L208DRAFT_1260865 [Tricholoma matsutake 945]